ncbi:MAG: hypothetical protein DMG76_14960 [Acidobacteria bacterium]|nr:MAG: hypothetical protein DMG76_14960 [Acidobacteriota bacterium]
MSAKVNNYWRKATTCYSMSAGSLPGQVMRSAGKLDEAARPLLLITAQPLVHGGDGDLRRTSGAGFMPC